MDSGQFQRSEEPFSLKKRIQKEHILVIRFSAMGDVAMLVPVLKVVTAAYPFLEITVLTRAFFAPLFQGIENVKVFSADLKGRHSGMGGLTTLAKELRKLNITAVADMHDVLRSNFLKTLFYFYGIPVKQIDKGRREKKALTTANNKVFKQLKSTHQRYADVFKQLNYPVDLKKYTYPPKQELTKEIREFSGGGSFKLIGVAPFAQHGGKVYPLDLMERVLEQLNAERHLKILLFGGGKNEKILLENLEAKFRSVVSLAGKFSLEEELSIISNLDLMLSMDSGNAHLAAIYGVPVVTLWGATHPYAGFAPFNQPKENCILPDLLQYPAIPTSIYGNKVPAGYEDVMRSITPEKVVERLKIILEAKKD